MKRLLLVIALFLLIFPVLAEEGLAVARVQTGAGEALFDVELAQTPEQQATGLMYRRSMPENHGMWFDFEGQRRVAMWMKNTYIPLDMVFLNEHRVIVHIVRNTTPLSTARIMSPVHARYVLELNAGVADKYGLAAGQKITLEPKAAAPESAQEIQ